MQKPVVVRLKTVGNDDQFLGSSEGCFYWTKSLSNAKFFNDANLAYEALNGYDFTKESKMSDGTINPPRMIHTGLKLSFDNTFGRGTIEMCQVDLICGLSYDIEGEIKKPTGYMY